MKIITWNVNGIRSALQKGFHGFWEKQNPDILCLQETKAHPDQLGEDVCLKGWTGYWSSAQRAGYSGTATFTKKEPGTISYGIDIPKFDAEGRFVVTEFKDFALYNVYFPNGGARDERHQFKQEFLKRFTHHLVRKIQSGREVIVLGDYNVAYLDHDVYDPKECGTISGFLPEEREWMRAFLDQGFTDSFRHFHPDEKERYTWWSYQQNGRMSNRGWRIDHICVSPGLKKKLKSCQILDDQEGSDHCPVVLELNL